MWTLTWSAAAASGADAARTRGRQLRSDGKRPHWDVWCAKGGRLACEPLDSNQGQGQICPCRLPSRAAAARLPRGAAPGAVPVALQGDKRMRAGSNTSPLSTKQAKACTYRLGSTTGTDLRQKCCTAPACLASTAYRSGSTYREEREGKTVAARAATAGFLPRLYQLATNLTARRLNARPALVVVPQHGRTWRGLRTGCGGGQAGWRPVCPLASTSWLGMIQPCLPPDQTPERSRPALAHTQWLQHEGRGPSRACLTCQAGRPWRP